MTNDALSLRAEGVLEKMRVHLDTPVRYELSLNGEAGPLVNDFIGQPIRLEYIGQINCLSCGRKSNKSFNQGFCYPCFKKLPGCDTCIVKPETCHFAEGTCRDESWGLKNCFAPHIVYLANSSGLKVGITRQTQIPTRWIDQGAVQALPIMEVDNRLQSGLVETIFAKQVADKTNWRAMLKGDVLPIDLKQERDRLFELCDEPLQQLISAQSGDAIRKLDAEVVEIHVPVRNHPTKVTSFNFDKTPVVEGILEGVKGQYLILDTGVINLRKFGAYNIKFFA